MKIQFLNGGLANQVFQYIFAKYYELTYPGQIMYLDDSYFAVNTVHNGYELDKVFGLKPHFISECFEPDVWEYMLEEKRAGKSIPQILCDNGLDIFMLSEAGDSYQRFNPFYGRVSKIPYNEYIPQILEITEDVYYHGYWINREWFQRYRDIFLEELSFPKINDNKNQEYLYQILTGSSVAIHIRRGDFLNLGIQMKESSYKEMIQMFQDKIETATKIEKDIKKWIAFIFSDDIEWCKQNWRELGLNKFQEIMFVEGNMCGKNYIDMQLMSQCKGMIMSNSSFSYLAALLNTRKQVIINPTKRQL